MKLLPRGLEHDLRFRNFGKSAAELVKGPQTVLPAAVAWAIETTRPVRVLINTATASITANVMKYSVSDTRKVR